MEKMSNNEVVGEIKGRGKKHEGRERRIREFQGRT